MTKWRGLTSMGASECVERDKGRKGSTIDGIAGLNPQLRTPSLLFMIAGWLFTIVAVALESDAIKTEEMPMGVLKLTGLSAALVLGGFAVDLSAAAG